MICVLLPKESTPISSQTDERQWKYLNGKRRISVNTNKGMWHGKKALKIEIIKTMMIMFIYRFLCGYILVHVEQSMKMKLFKTKNS